MHTGKQIDKRQTHMLTHTIIHNYPLKKTYTMQNTVIHTVTHQHVDMLTDTDTIIHKVEWYTHKHTRTHARTQTHTQNDTYIRTQTQ